LYNEADVTEEDKRMLDEYADLAYDHEEIPDELQDKFDEFEKKPSYTCLYQCIRANITFIVFLEFRGVM
jgi:hypothetical protein